ncbi:MAG: ABC transporter ATP-binding protein [Bacillota bacterium]
MDVLTVENLSVAFGTTHRVVAVDNVSFSVQAGAMTVLLGPSGCGKTTTLRCIAGLEKPTAGEIKVGGRVLTSVSSGIYVPAEYRNLGMVFQSYAVWPHMSVFENVAFPLKVRKTKGDTVKREVSRVLKALEIEHLASRYPTQLSGGQQQRVALARSLVANPRLLLLDEPLSNLDAKLRQRMRVELKALQQLIGITCLYVTHDQEEAMSLADEVIVMRDGRIVGQGPPREVYHNPRSVFVATFLGEANIFSAELIRGSDNRPYLQTGGTTLRIEDVGGVPDGPVSVCIRPEDVQIASKPGSAQDENIIQATVVQADFLGDRVSLLADCSALGTWKVLASTRFNVEKGSVICLRCDPKVLKLLTDDEGQPKG